MPDRVIMARCRWSMTTRFDEMRVDLATRVCCLFDDCGKVLIVRVGKETANRAVSFVIITGLVEALRVPHVPHQKLCAVFFLLL